jgi:hypothetical protein
MGCDGSYGFGDVEDDKKYDVNEKRPDSSTNGNAQYKKDNENKVGKDNNKGGGKKEDNNNDDKKNGNKNDNKNIKKDDKKDWNKDGKKDGNKIDDKNNKIDEKKNTKSESKEGQNINTNDPNNEITTDERKVNLNLQKEDYEGVLLMQGMDDCFTEDLTEEDVYKLVTDALNDKIIDDEKEQEPGTINSKQAKAIANILYNKINKKDNDNKINLKKYPELKGVNVKIGVEKFTKDVGKKMMFQDKKVDDKQIDKAYSQINKDNEEYKALTIEILK